MITAVFYLDREISANLFPFLCLKTFVAAKQNPRRDPFSPSQKNVETLVLTAFINLSRLFGVN